jgi:peptidoglycan/LPS O-acetylase OafA/YrhL
MMRGLAALAVAGFHAREVTWIGLRAFWHLYGLSGAPFVLLSYLLGCATLPLVWGSIGVPIFFVISGYCIHRSQAYSYVQTKTYNLPTLNFLTRRFIRIYPVLFGALLLTLACDRVSAHFFQGIFGDTSLSVFLTNLFSVQGVVGPYYGSNVPLWTLAIEVQFYALYPLLLVLMFRLGKGRTFLALCLVNMVSYFFLERRGYSLFTSFYPLWYLGVLVAEYEIAKPPFDWLSSTRSRIILYISSLALLIIGCGVDFFGPYLSFQIWGAAFALFLMRRIWDGPTKPPTSAAKIFGSLGRFSFSLYIVHLPIIVLINSVLFNSVRQPSFLPLFLVLGSAVGCAYIFFWICESPALTLSQKLKPRKRFLSSQLNAKQSRPAF